MDYSSYSNGDDLKRFDAEGEPVSAGALGTESDQEDNACQREAGGFQSVFVLHIYDLVSIVPAVFYLVPHGERVGDGDGWMDLGA